MTITATAPAATSERTKINSIVFASCLGTIIEWYDFLIYATGAALVFNKAFFPTFDPLAGTLAALGSYAVGFLARPLGGALFGHFGDRLGRKSMLVLTLFIMGGEHLQHRPAADLRKDRGARADAAVFASHHPGHRSGR